MPANRRRKDVNLSNAPQKIDRELYLTGAIMSSEIEECPHNDSVRYPVTLTKSFEGVMNLPPMSRKYLLCQKCISRIIDEIPNILNK